MLNPLLEHRARRLAQPAVVVEVVAVALDDHGGFIGRLVLAAAAALTLVSVGCDLRHRHIWDICPACASPPHHIASEAGRQALARTVHGRGRMFLRLLAVVAQLVAMGLAGTDGQHIAVRVAATLACAAVGLWIYREIRRVVWHTDVADECSAWRCQPARLRSVTVAFTHFQPWLTITLAAGCVVAVGREAVFAVAFLGFLLLSVSGPDDGGRHSADDLCPHCRVPRDPNTAIARWRTVLRSCHTEWWDGLWTAASAALLVAFLLALAGTDHPRTLYLLLCGYVVVRASMLAAEELVHAPLVPWCPWCRSDGDGGWFAEDPDPDPTLCNSAPTPVGATT